jgi:hypothetical protein
MRSSRSAVLKARPRPCSQTELGRRNAAPTVAHSHRARDRPTVTLVVVADCRTAGAGPPGTETARAPNRPDATGHALLRPRADSPYSRGTEGCQTVRVGADGRGHASPRLCGHFGATRETRERRRTAMVRKGSPGGSSPAEGLRRPGWRQGYPVGGRGRRRRRGPRAGHRRAWFSSGAARHRATPSRRRVAALCGSGDHAHVLTAEVLGWCGSHRLEQARVRLAVVGGDLATI